MALQDLAVFLTIWTAVSLPVAVALGRTLRRHSDAHGTCRCTRSHHTPQQPPPGVHIVGGKHVRR